MGIEIWLMYLLLDHKKPPYQLSFAVGIMSALAYLSHPTKADKS